MVPPIRQRKIVHKFFFNLALSYCPLGVMRLSKSFVYLFIQSFYFPQPV